MVKEKVMSELKQRIAEAGLDHIISVNEDVNKMGTFMVHRDHQSKLEMFAVDGEPLFPFDAITNILYDDRIESMHYCTEETAFRILFELYNDYLLIYEIGDQGNAWLLRNDRNEWFTDGKKGTDELKSYNDKFQKRIFIKNLIWSIIPDINRFDDDFVASEDLKTIEETIWSYIYETPQDTEMLLFFAHQILHCKMYDDDNKITIDVPRILQYIQDKDLKDALLMYIRGYWLNKDGEICMPDAFLEEVALAMKYLKQILQSSTLEGLFPHIAIWWRMWYNGKNKSEAGDFHEYDKGNSA